MINVLLVEDDPTLTQTIKETLEGPYFSIHSVTSGEEGLRKFFDMRPDVLVTDVMTPRMDGLEMVRLIRQTDKLTPVLFLTDRSPIDNAAEGFEMETNDSLKKPFGMQDLVIGIKKLMDRASLFAANKKQQAQAGLTIGCYRFYPITQRLVFVDPSTVPHQETEFELSYRESEILKRMYDNRNQVVISQSVLLDLWGDDTFFNSRSMHVFITKLRNKLSKDECVHIANVRGMGYKLVMDEP